MGYDHFRYPDGRLGLCVADVSGKGVPAALFMTMTKGVLAAARHDSGDWPSVLTELNGHLGGVARRRSFVTMAAASIDPVSGVVDHVRAGHNPVLWRRAARGESVFLKPAGLGLGLAGNASFARVLRMERIQLEPRDALVFYSDGITEAMNEAREQFGEERLCQVVEDCDGRDAASTEAAILAAVRAFMGKSPPHDDMTLFVGRFD
ncbi:MAG: serine/threonine-protein phosphatase [Acidobacteria bacterium]|nr:serine/threonine-protein phosphatase [Acidobacteriota bacterium]